jgi:hypothetical protein
MGRQVNPSIVVLLLSHGEGFSPLEDLHVIGARGNEPQAEDKEYKDHERTDLQVHWDSISHRMMTN